MSTFFVRSLGKDEPDVEGLAEAAEETLDISVTRGGPVSVSVDEQTGALSVEFVVSAGFNLTASINAAYYTSHDGDDGFVPSGAYVFRPDSSQTATARRFLFDRRLRLPH